MRDCKIKANTRVEWYELFGVRTQCDFPGKLRPWQRRWRRREIPRAERIGLHGNHPKANPGYIRTYIYPCRGASATLPLLRSLFINLLPFPPLSTLPYCPPSTHPKLSFSLSPVICFTSTILLPFILFFSRVSLFRYNLPTRFLFYLHNHPISLSFRFILRSFYASSSFLLSLFRVHFPSSRSKPNQ